MTQSSRPPIDSSVPPGMEAREVEELHSFYREASRAEPGPALDALILGAAHAEVNAANAARETALRRTPPWWKRWLPATSAIAVAVLGLSITLRMVDQGGLETHAILDEAGVPSAKSSETPTTPALAAPTTAAPSSSVQPPLANQLKFTAPVEEIVGRRAADAAPAPTPQQSEAESGRSASGASAAPEPLRQQAAAPAAKKQERAERPLSAPLEARADKAVSAGVAAEAQEAQEAEVPSAEKAMTPPATAAGMNEMGVSPVDEKMLTPTAWLERIRTLRTGGRIDEARQSLARFKTRFPDHALPEDLAELN